MEDFHKIRYHCDDRAHRYCDIFPEIGVGDINVSIIAPGAAALWHRHRNQTDYQIVVKGNLQIGMGNMPRVFCKQDFNEWMEFKNNVKYPSAFDTTGPMVVWHTLSERNAMRGPLVIPRGLWHGCVNMSTEDAILIYHITKKYDPSDEQRMTVEEAGWSIERIVK